MKTFRLDKQRSRFPVFFCFLSSLDRVIVIFYTLFGVFCGSYDCDFLHLQPSMGRVIVVFLHFACVTFL